MSADSEADQLQAAFGRLVRALGLLRPDTTPCGAAMSITEAHAIGEIQAGGPIPQQALADALRLQKSTVSRLVDQLTADGLVERMPNPDDRRSHLIGLTSKGRSRAERLDRARRDLFCRLLAGLDASERGVVLEGITMLERAARGLA